jgi:hypothetical protein
MTKPNEIAELVEHLRLGELWFDVTTGDKGLEGETIPVNKKHGMWLFKTAADALEQLSAERDELKFTNALLCADANNAQARIAELEGALRGLWEIPVEGGIRAHPDDMAKAIAIARAALKEQ